MKFFSIQTAALAAAGVLAIAAPKPVRAQDANRDTAVTQTMSAA